MDARSIMAYFELKTTFYKKFKTKRGIVFPNGEQITNTISYLAIPF